jgi:hypothetical protein
MDTTTREDQSTNHAEKDVQQKQYSTHYNTSTSHQEPSIRFAQTPLGWYTEDWRRPQVEGSTRW